jgi:hypothetical protein
MRIIKGNQKDKFRRKHIVKITFRKKGYCQDDVIFSLSINNPFPISLKLVHILGSLVSFN